MDFQRKIFLLFFLIILTAACSPGVRLTGVRKTIFVNKIDSLRSEGKISEAIDSLNSIIDKDVKAAWAYNGLGEIYFRYGSIGYNKMAAMNYKRALRFDKKSSDYLVNYALLQLRLEEYYQAEKYFKRALKYDPGNGRAFEGLLEMYTRRKDEKGILEIEEYFMKTSSKNAVSCKALLGLGEGFLKAKNYTKAEEYFNRARTMSPGNPVVKLRYSTLYTAREDYRKAADYFIQGITKLTDNEELNKILDEMRDIMTEDERKAYEYTFDDEKWEYLYYFWKKKDPDLLTEENERLIEHLKRLRHVRIMYASQFPPYYDVRGRIYVRYGEPDGKHVMHGGTPWMKSNESWAYFRINPYLSFDFVEAGGISGIYRIARDLTEAVSLRMRNTEDMFLEDEERWATLTLREMRIIDMYAARSYLGGIYSIISTGTNIFADISQGEALKIEAEINSPVENFFLGIDYDLINIDLLVFQYKERDNKTGIGLFFGIDKKFSETEDRLTVFDSYYNRISTVEKRGACIKTENQNLLFETLSLEPSYYFIGGEIKTPDGKRGGNFKIPLNTRNFQPDSLYTSDLLFAEKIEEAAGKAGFVRNGLRIIPVMTNSVKKDDGILLYFEIYNLTYNQTGRTRYRLNYTIRQRDSKGNFILKGIKAVGRILGKQDKDIVGLSYVREGESIDTFESIHLNLSELGKGDSLLEVEVIDLQSQGRRKIEKSFNIR